MPCQNNWKGLYLEAEAALNQRNLDNGHLNMILFGMLYADEPYWEVLHIYSKFRGEAPERMHSHLCYALLQRGLEIGPEELLSQIKMEVKSED